MLYNLSPIQKHQEQIWSYHKIVTVNPGSSFGKSPRAWAYNHLVQVLTAFIIPIILYQFQKDPFCHIILYAILFYFIHVYKAPGQDETTLGDNVLMQAHFFHDFIHVHSPWAGADNPLGPNVWCQQEGLITMVIYCKFEKNTLNLWLYTHLFMI